MQGVSICKNMKNRQNRGEKCVSRPGGIPLLQMADRRGAGAGGNAAGGDRRAGFKFAGMTTEELRRRREENQVEIRKAKREDSLNKRRNLVEVATPTMSSAPTITSPNASDNNSLDVKIEEYLFINRISP